MSFKNKDVERTVLCDLDTKGKEGGDLAAKETWGLDPACPPTPLPTLSPLSSLGAGSTGLESSYLEIATGDCDASSLAREAHRA